MALKTVARRGLESIGLSVRRSFRGTVDGLPQETIRSTATYAPWVTDEDFVSTLRTVSSHTLVDVYRCWELWQLVEQVSHLPGGIVEVGVWRGGTGCLMAKRAQLLGLDTKVYLCDTFEGVVKASDLDVSYHGGEHSDASAAIVRDLAARLGLDNVVIVEGIFPDDTEHLVEDEQIRLLHIDVDVHDSARAIVEYAWPRVPMGGAVVFDDYGYRTTTGVTRYVNETMHERDRMMIYNLNGHAVFVKTA